MHVSHCVKATQGIGTVGTVLLDFESTRHGASTTDMELSSWGPGLPALSSLPVVALATAPRSTATSTSGGGGSSSGIVVALALGTRDVRVWVVSGDGHEHEHGGAEELAWAAVRGVPFLPRVLSVAWDKGHDEIDESAWMLASHDDGYAAWRKTKRGPPRLGSRAARSSDSTRSRRRRQRRREAARRRDDVDNENPVIFKERTAADDDDANSDSNDSDVDAESDPPDFSFSQRIFVASVSSAALSWDGRVHAVGWGATSWWGSPLRPQTPWLVTGMSIEVAPLTRASPSLLPRIKTSTSSRALAALLALAPFTRLRQCTAATRCSSCTTLT